MQWVLTGYLLALASLILLGGALGDRYGRRRVFVIGTVWFAAASLLCGAAPSIEVLVVARVLQGVGAALLTPGSLAILQASFQRDDRSCAVGAWSGLERGCSGRSDPSSAVGSSTDQAGGGRSSSTCRRCVRARLRPCRAGDEGPAYGSHPRPHRRGDRGRHAGVGDVGPDDRRGTRPVGRCGHRRRRRGCCRRRRVRAPDGHRAGPAGAAVAVRSRESTVTNLATVLLYAGLGVSFFLVAYGLQVAAGWSATAPVWRCCRRRCSCWSSPRVRPRSPSASDRGCSSPSARSSPPPGCFSWCASVPTPRGCATCCPAPSCSGSDSSRSSRR